MVDDDAMTAFLPSIHGEINVGKPPETSLHCLPNVWNAETAPFVFLEISVLTYHPPKLLCFDPYLFHTSSTTNRLCSISIVMSPVSQ